VSRAKKLAAPVAGVDRDGTTEGLTDVPIEVKNTALFGS